MQRGGFPGRLSHHGLPGNSNTAGEMINLLAARLCETLIWFALRSHTGRNARRKPKRKPNCQGRLHVYLKDAVAAQTIAQTNRC